MSSAKFHQRDEVVAGRSREVSPAEWLAAQPSEQLPSKECSLGADPISNERLETFLRLARAM